MEKQSNIWTNYILNTFNQILSLIVPLITAPYLSRVLGSDGIGIQSYTSSIVAYFSIVAVLGTSAFGQRNIAFYRNDLEKKSQSFWEIFSLRVITSSIALIAYYLLVIRDSQYQVIFLILSCNILGVIIDINWFYQGIEEFKKIVIISIFVRILQTACIFLFIKDENDLILYIAFVAIFTVIGNASMWIGLKKHILKPHNVNPLRNIKAVVLLFLPTIAVQVYMVLDKSMIGWVTQSMYQNGCYEQAEKIARMALTVITSISTVILPRVANLYKNNQLDRAKEYIYLGYRFVWLLAMPIMFGLIGISSTFVPVFFGPGYELAKALIPIFSILVVAVSLAHVTGYAYLIPTEQQNVYTIAVTVAAIINLLMNILLIPLIGATGAALGSITAEIIGVAIQIGYCIKTNQLVYKKIFSGCISYSFAAILMLGVIIVTKLFLPVNLFGLTIMIIIGVCSYLAILLIIKDRFLIDSCVKIKTKILKSK